MQILPSKPTFNNQKMQICIKHKTFHTNQELTRTIHLLCQTRNKWHYTHIYFICVVCVRHVHYSIAYIFVFPGRAADTISFSDIKYIYVAHTGNWN